MSFCTLMLLRITVQMDAQEHLSSKSRTPDFANVQIQGIWGMLESKSLSGYF